MLTRLCTPSCVSVLKALWDKTVKCLTSLVPPILVFLVETVCHEVITSSASVLLGGMEEYVKTVM